MVVNTGVVILNRGLIMYSIEIGFLVLLLYLMIVITGLTAMGITMKLVFWRFLHVFKKYFHGKGLLFSFCN
jgi:hypothetical protein